MMMFGVLCPFQHSSAQGLHDDALVFYVLFNIHLLRVYMMMFGVLCPFQYSSAQGLHDDVWCFMSFSTFICSGST